MSIDAMSLLVKVQAQGVAETKKALEGVSSEGETSKSHLSGLLTTIAGFAGGAAIVGVASGAFNFLKGQLTDSYQAGIQANDVMAQLSAGLRSTRDASGQTTASLSNLADQIMSYSGISDDAVKTGEAMLLTFTGIGKSVFPAATQAAADMATKMNGGMIPTAQQMQQQALLLGKALNDPLKGITALQREGVTFTAQQKKQITAMEKAGNTAGAQKVILAELNKEFGGSAKAAGQANGGLAILSAKFDEMREQIGQALIPVVTKLFAAFAPVVNQLSAALPGALAAVSGFITGQMLPAVTRFSEWMKTDGAPDLQKLTKAFQENLLPAIKGIASFITGTLVPAVATVAQKLADFTNYLTTHKDAMNAFKAVLVGVAAAIAVSLVAAFVAWAVAAGAAAIATIAATWPILAVGAGVALLIFGIKELVSHWGDISRFFGNIKRAIGDFFGRIGSFFANLNRQALTWGEDMVKNLANGIRNAVGSVTSAVQNVASTIKSFLHFSKPDVGPLANVDEWMPDMGRKLAQGLDAQRAMVGAAASRVAGSIGVGMLGGASSGIAPAMLGGGGGVGHVAASSGRKTPLQSTFIIQLDGRVIARNTIEHMPDIVRMGTGVRHI